MAAPNPSVLTKKTRFQPVTLRGHSRSPSRSPLRKSQFAARELDPLLRNLSPDSTLKALQATSTITSNGNGQDALARSIAEASPAEREIGIRAAIAGQKLKQWHQEVSRWPWPARRDRGWGAGFLPPLKDGGPNPMKEHASHLGFLPTNTVFDFQDRIEDIRDGIEALELDDIKDHVFSAHVPQRSVSAPHTLDHSPDAKSTGYGRMRDFTALITATVIQALPELASLTMLLDTWDIRLSVLTQIPDITDSFSTTRAGVQTAFSVVRGKETGPLVTMEEYETTKSILGGRVASLGAKIDKLLDMLEGQEDSLPKSWIDALENVENEYATFVVEAEHIVIRNDLLSKALAEQSKPQLLAIKVHADTPSGHQDNTESARAVEMPAVSTTLADKPETATPLAELPGSDFFGEFASGRKYRRKSDISNKPPLSIAVPSTGHKRGVSEISMADSTFSAMSDLSTAEIVDAKSTKVLASPKISVVQNPFRGSRDELSWFTTPALDLNSEPRPPMVHRASTASIEVVSRDSVKQVTLPRSRSHDMLRQVSPPSLRPSTPSQALQQLSGVSSRSTPSPEGLEVVHNHQSTVGPTTLPEASTAIVSPSPSLRVNPLQLKAKDVEGRSFDSPEIPRRSSKRHSQILPVDSEEPIPLTTISSSDEASLTPTETVPPTRQLTEHPDETLESRIKDILNTMPTKIRLARDSDSDEVQQVRSTSSTRSSTPVPSLTLSPVKTDRPSRQAAPGDVRLFHLTKSGQSRDAPPVKLFVRTVGEHGERVMVRVGGGWADLAEYLREYSLHHGHRGLADGNLEVANFPATQTSQKDVSTPAPSGLPVNQPMAGTVPTQSTIKRRSVPAPSFNPDDSFDLSMNKLRQSGRDGMGSESSDVAANNRWTPPPVPPIPTTYITQSPTTMTTWANGISNTNTVSPVHPALSSNKRIISTPVVSRSVNGRMSSGTATNSSPLNEGHTYTPLGAAGPKSGGRRTTGDSIPSGLDRESWVEGMVGKARAVSGGPTFVQGPTTTTTTTVVSRSTPTNRRVSTFSNPGPANTLSTTSPNSARMATSTNPGTVSPRQPLPISQTNFITASPASMVSTVSPSPTPSKNRMSLSDVSGIKRVFLRRKSSK